MPFRNQPTELQRADFGSLGTLGAILDFVLHGLAFVQAAVAATFDSGEVREHVGATSVRRDEAEALLSVEPFDFARLSHDLKRPK